jgi:hypothetical protein
MPRGIPNKPKQAQDGLALMDLSPADPIPDNPPRMETKVGKRIPVSLALAPEAIKLMDEEAARLGMPSRSYYIEWLFMRTMGRLPIMYRDLQDYRAIEEEMPPEVRPAAQPKPRSHATLAKLKAMIADLEGE